MTPRHHTGSTRGTLRRKAHQTVQAGISKCTSAAAGMSETSVAIIAFAVAAVITLAGAAIVSRGQLVELEVGLPNGVTAERKTSDGRIEFFDIIGNLFSDPIRSAAAQAILEGRGLYALSSANLERAIKQMEPGTELADGLITMLKENEGPFKLDQHFFRNVREAAIVAEFDKQAEENYEVVVNELRRHCEYEEGFCRDKDLPGYVSFVSTVSEGEAAVCSASRLVGRSVVIVNKQSLRQTTIVSARKYFSAMHRRWHAEQG